MKDDARAKWCSENCRKRSWEKAPSAVLCAACSRPLVNDSARKRARLCRPCFRESQRRTMAARDAIVASLWADGLSLSEIADAMGWTVAFVRVEFDRIRRRSPGLLPYRYKLSNPKRQAA